MAFIYNTKMGANDLRTEGSLGTQNRMVRTDTEDLKLLRDVGNDKPELLMIERQAVIP